MANVALPDIGKASTPGQTSLNLVAVGYSLGLAASVLYLGALGDRYGRKLMLILGTALAIPASLVAALAPSIEVLFGARLVGGLAAGMAYPTTLALITALWSGPARTKSIALWSALGGAIAALGPLLSGALLTGFDWGSVFVITLPLAVVALYLAIRYVPAHVNETTDPVDNLGGILSVLLVAALVLAINFAPVPNKGARGLGLAAIALAAGAAFVIRQRRAPSPLYDLEVAGRRIFWVAACAGIIVFGTLMGAMFIGQQFLQNVLGYSTLDAGLAILPAAAHGAGRAALGQARRGARRAAHAARRLRLLPARLPHDAPAVEGGHLLLEGRPRLRPDRDRRGVRRHAGVALAHRLGAGRRAGMASGPPTSSATSAGRSCSRSSARCSPPATPRRRRRDRGLAEAGDKITDQVQAELTKSFSSAADTAAAVSRVPEPDHRGGAKSSFLQGDEWAYLAGIVAILLGAALVFFLFPTKEPREALLAQYHAEDAEGARAGGRAGARSVERAMTAMRWRWPRPATRRAWDLAIALGFAVGSACFLVGPFPGFVELVGAGADGVVFFVGSVFFTLAAASSCASPREAWPPLGPGRDLVERGVQFAGTAAVQRQHVRRHAGGPLHAAGEPAGLGARPSRLGGASWSRGAGLPGRERARCPPARRTAAGGRPP